MAHLFSFKDHSESIKVMLERAHQALEKMTQPNRHWFCFDKRLICLASRSIRYGSLCLFLRNRVQGFQN